MPASLSSTTPVNDAVHGWSPPGGDDEDVNICPLTTIPQKAGRHPFQPSPLAPLPRRGGPNIPIAPSSDRRAQRNRNRDPSWIPRPRNAFIIFRCEYSREHSQGSRDSPNDEDGDDSGATVKTLSKRAGDAWKKLSASEKERYKVMADLERDEHARLYPFYRFRPMKRQTPQGTKKPSLESSKTDQPLSPAPSTHVPSVLSSAPEKLLSSTSLESDQVPGPVLEVATELLHEHQPCLADPQPPLLQLDFTDQLLYPPPETTTSSCDALSSASLESSYSPLCSISISPDTFNWYEPSFSLDQTKEDLERAQALEAYAIGLYNFDLFSPFSFPEYC